VKKTPAHGFSSLKSIRTVKAAKLTPEPRTDEAAGVCGVEGSGVDVSVDVGLIPW